jgi:hypothetical protein
MMTLMVKTGTSVSDFLLDIGLPKLHCKAMIKGKIPVSAAVAQYLRHKAKDHE